ncbi:MAG: hypothetical protein GWP09_00400 [Nitrospiraceae bacterium]|nr:hypothetical protein [Nitrospiraceae bacterium]
MEAVAVDSTEKQIKNIESYLTILDSRVKSLEVILPSRVELADSLDVTKDGIVLLDIFAKWCVPCYQMQPSLEQVAKELEESGDNKKYNIRFYRLDIDRHPELQKVITKDLNLKELAIPLLILYKDGKIITTLTGSPSSKRTDIVRWLVWRALVPDDEWNKTYTIVKKIAEKMGWYLNPNKFLVDGLVSALTYNYLRFGRRYCPCKMERVPENTCPCRPYGDYPGSKKRIEEKGICYCGLFVSKEALEKWKKK